MGQLIRRIGAIEAGIALWVYHIVHDCTLAPRFLRNEGII